MTLQVITRLGEVAASQSSDELLRSFIENEGDDDGRVFFRIPHRNIGCPIVSL